MKTLVPLSGDLSQFHPSTLPSIDAATAGDLWVEAHRSVVLTESQADTLFSALGASLPANAAPIAFSVVRNTDGSAQLQIRANRIVRPAQLVTATRSGLAHGVVGEVVDA